METGEILMQSSCTKIIRCLSFKLHEYSSDPGRIVLQRLCHSFRLMSLLREYRARFHWLEFEIHGVTVTSGKELGVMGKFVVELTQHFHFFLCACCCCALFLNGNVQAFCINFILINRVFLESFN